MQRPISFTRVASVIVTLATIAACSGGATPSPSLSGDPSAAASPTEASSALPLASPATNPAQQALAGWLAFASNGVVFLQWTQSGVGLSGSMSQAYTAPGDPTHLQHQNAPFTGVLSGTSVTLNFPQGLGTSTTWTGALTSDTLILSYPASDGSLSTQTFHPATVADYNTALATKQATVQQAQAEQEAAAASAAGVEAEAQRLARAKSAIGSAAAAVATDIASIGSDVSSLEADLNLVLDDLASMQKDVESTYTDLQAVLVEAQQYPDGNDGGVCTDASGVATDASGVATDMSGIETDGSGLETDISGIEDDLTALRTDQARLQAAMAALPSYQPGGLPTAAQIAKALSSGSDAISQARRTFSGYLAQAKQMVETANNYASSAQQACSRVGG